MYQNTRQKRLCRRVEMSITLWKFEIHTEKTCFHCSEKSIPRKTLNDNQGKCMQSQIDVDIQKNC